MAQKDQTLLAICASMMAFGIVLLLAGIVSYAYSEQRLIYGLIPYYYTVYPYRDFAAPLLGVGALLLVAGFLAYIWVRRGRA